MTSPSTPDETDSIIRDLTVLAPVLNDLPAVADGPFRFDLFSESIIWDDELPSGSLRSKLLWSLRPVFYYRSTLSQGHPDTKSQRYWVVAHQLFPSWPGFRPERLNPAPEILRLLIQKRQEIECAVQRSLQRRGEQRGGEQRGHP